MLLYTSIFSILVSGILTANNWKTNRNSALLGLALLTIALYGLAHHFLAIDPSPLGVFIFYNHFTPIFLLTGPFVYFYIRGTVGDNYLPTKTDLLHFLPALIQAVGILPWLFMPYGEKMELATSLSQDINRIKDLHPNLFYSPLVATYLRFFLLLSYLIAGWVLWRNLSPKKTGVPTRQITFSYRWIAILIGSLLALDLLLILISWDAASHNIRESLLFSRSLQIVTGTLFAALPLSLLFFPQILYGMPSMKAVSETREQVASTTAEKKQVGQQNILSSASETGEEPFLELASRIQEHLKSVKPFIRPDYRFDDLALELGVPANHLAYCLNEVMHTKFTSLRMQYRVEYAKELILAGEHEQFTIEGIAQKAGFGSRSNFYSAFREITGLSPTEFIDRQNTSASAAPENQVFKPA